MSVCSYVSRKISVVVSCILNLLLVSFNIDLYRHKLPIFFLLFSHLQGPEEQFDQYGGARSLPRSAGFEETVSMMEPFVGAARDKFSDTAAKMYGQNGLERLFGRQKAFLR